MSMINLDSYSYKDLEVPGKRMLYTRKMGTILFGSAVIASVALMGIFLSLTKINEILFTKLVFCSAGLFIGNCASTVAVRLTYSFIDAQFKDFYIQRGAIPKLEKQWAQDRPLNELSKL